MTANRIFIRAAVCAAPGKPALPGAAARDFPVRIARESTQWRNAP